MSEDKRHAIDPICNMPVDTQKAKFTLVNKGKTYYFCSHACKSAFEKHLSQFT
jgi:YHS domain-containing protein